MVEYRLDQQRYFGGKYTHKLLETEAGFKIEQQRVDLANVEGPFDSDGSSFSLPLDSICLTISHDLLDRDVDHVQHLNSKDPVRWT